MANRSVVLYLRTKIKKKWAYSKVSEDLSKLVLGDYYLSWYVGARKRLRSVGNDPKKAIEKLEKKRLELAYVAAGGEVRQSDVPLDGQGQRKRVSAAVKDYLDDCADRQGKSGYGLAVRTPEAYEYRLGFLIEFRPEACLEEVNAAFVRGFRHFLREHPKDLSDRTCYNIMQAVSTFLLQYGIAAAKPFLKQMHFAPTIVVPYSKEDMQTFFDACDDEEELVFKFFLHSMCREMEVANCEVRDLKFEKNILHICPKPDKGFRLKGKRSGQATKGRKVPLPTRFMERMKAFCADKKPRDLVFTNGVGKVEFHFLRKCKKIAKRAGIENWAEWDLHRWRKTGATRHHESGVSVRKIQAWLGHESLEVTLDYLGVEDAADEISQEQVNNGALAAYV